MTFRWIDGFDYYSADVPFSTRYAGLTGTYGVAGRFGGFCYSTGGSNFPISIPATDTICVGCAVRATIFSSSQLAFIHLKGAGISQFVLSNNNAGLLSVYRGNQGTGTLLGTASGHAFDATAWHYIELVLTRNGTTGSVQVYFDGTLVIDLSNVNTDNGNSFDTVEILPGGGTSCDCDDLYINDAAVRIGERRIETLHPASDASVQWTPSASGSNTAMVDETQGDGDTTYVSTATVGDKDLYNLGALSDTPSAIDAVQVTNIVRKTDSNSHTVRGNIKSGATTSAGTAQSVGSSYGAVVDIFTADPNGSVAWTAAAVNAAQIGPELVA